MPTIFVASGCSNQKDEAKGISLHVIPFFEDERPEANRRRTKWVDFVKQKRAKWQPSNHSTICSVHFKPEDHSASASGASANADAKALSLSFSISYPGDELSGDSSEFSSLNSTSSSDEDILLFWVSSTS